MLGEKEVEKKVFHYNQTGGSGRGGRKPHVGFERVIQSKTWTWSLHSLCEPPSDPGGSGSSERLRGVGR